MERRIENARKNKAYRKYLNSKNEQDKQTETYRNKCNEIKRTKKSAYYPS